jgi:hypothetical protein
MNNDSSSRIAKIKKASLDSNKYENFLRGNPSKNNVDYNSTARALGRRRSSGYTVKPPIIPPRFEEQLVGFMKVLYENSQHPSFDRELSIELLKNLVTEKTLFIIGYSKVKNGYFVFSKTEKGFEITDGIISIDEEFTVNFGHGCIFINKVYFEEQLVGFMKVSYNNKLHPSFDRELSIELLRNLVTEKTLFIIGYSKVEKGYFVFSKTKKGFEITDGIISIDEEFIVNFGLGCIFINKLPNTFILNDSFEVPLIDTFKSYEDMTGEEKEAFKWTAGGIDGTNPKISNGGAGFRFPDLIDGGVQSLAMQNKCFIQQDIYFYVGVYVFSTYFYSRNGEQNNPIQVSINDEIITTINEVATEWKLFTHTFYILQEGNKILKLEGTKDGDLTTGIDLVTLSRKIFPYIPIPNDTFTSNTETRGKVEGYITSSSSVGYGREAFQAFNGDGENMWHSNDIGGTTYNDNDNGEYIGEYTTDVSYESISGEWLQIELPFAIILKSFFIQIGYSLAERYPRKFTLAGSNDGIKWDKIDSQTLLVNPDAVERNLNEYLTSSNSISYLYYRLITEALFGGDTIAISQFNLNGYEDGKITFPNIQNESFEFPVITDENHLHYNDFTESQKEEFKWFSGGNFDGDNVEKGAAVSDDGFIFHDDIFEDNLKINGKQALAIQRTSFIQQDIYLIIGTYIFSTYFMSKNGTENNPIQVSIDGTIITIINEVASTWRKFTHTFKIQKSGNKLLKLEGTSEENLTTGIDLVALSRKDDV